MKSILMLLALIVITSQTLSACSDQDKGKTEIQQADEASDNR